MVADEAWGIDFEAEVAVITGDVPMGATPAEAADAIRLVMLVNDVSLRNLIPGELAKGFGFFHGKPSTAFSPVAVTPDELGAAWRDGKLHLPLLASVNGKLLRPARTPAHDMTFDFPHADRARGQDAARSAPARIIGSGTVSNKDGRRSRQAGRQGGAGYACIAEVRTVETIRRGQAEDAVPAVRRPVAHRDDGRRRPFDLRRHRAGGRARRATVTSQFSPPRGGQEQRDGKSAA